MTTGEPIVEHAIMMSGGGMQVRNGHEIEALYPLADWVSEQQRFGGKVYTRKVVVVEDWHEVEQ